MERWTKCVFNVLVKCTNRQVDNQHTALWTKIIIIKKGGSRGSLVDHCFFFFLEVSNKNLVKWRKVSQNYKENHTNKY